MGRELVPYRIAPFTFRPEDPNATSGISSSFPELSQSRGLITHVLRTRAPLSSTPKGRFSFDLHVLGPPQTFALSQDQTLQFELCSSSPALSDRQLARFFSLVTAFPSRFRSANG